MEIQLTCIERHLCLFIFSPPVRMMRGVLCFGLVFYLSRSPRFFSFGFCLTWTILLYVHRSEIADDGDGGRPRIPPE